MSIFIPKARSYLMVNEDSTYYLDINSEGMTLYLASNEAPLQDSILFELKEPLLLANGTTEGDYIHLAFIKANGDLCYSVISITGKHHTTTLGRLDTRTNKYDQLVLFVVNKVIHIFYAIAHQTLPDVWRITHLLWNGTKWNSAVLGEAIHPRHPLFHILIDSKENLHVLTATFLGSRTVIMSILFNGSFHIWSKRQEVLSIPREVIDMTALITDQNKAFLFWAAKQPVSEKIEVGLATRDQVDSFSSTWKVESNAANNIKGPWKGLGAIYSDGMISLLVNAEMEGIVQYRDSWSLILTSPSTHDPFIITQSLNSSKNYSYWLLEKEQVPLFAKEAHLPFNSLLSDSFTTPTAYPAPASFGTEPSTNTYSVITSEPSTNSIDSTSFDNTPIDTTATSELMSEHTTHEDPSRIDAVEETMMTFMSDIQEQTMSLSNTIEDLSTKVEALPNILEQLMRRNEETIQALQQLEEKLAKMKSEHEIASSKKGFWEKWLT